MAENFSRLRVVSRTYSSFSDPPSMRSAAEALTRFLCFLQDRGLSPLGLRSPALPFFPSCQ